MMKPIFVYEPVSGVKHKLEIKCEHGCYNLMVDDQFFSTHDSWRLAEDEMVDVVNDAGWSAFKPFA